MPASPFASRGSGRPIQMDWTDHSVGGNSTGASGPHATAASPLLEATRPIDAGDGRFTSGCTASTASFRRLDATSAPSAPQSGLATRPLAARRSPDTISISMAIRVEAARWRKRRAGFLRWGTHRSERWRSAARDQGIFNAAGLHREAAASRGSTFRAHRAADPPSDPQR